MTAHFRSAYHHGFIRAAASSLPIVLAQPELNAAHVLTALDALADDAVGLVTFPELSLSGYSLDDLLLADPLLDATLAGIETIREASTERLPVVVVGAPLRWRHRVYNCAVVIHRGSILGVVPKSFLPNYREFYERRWFAPGDDVVGQTIRIGEQDVPFGSDLLFEASDNPDFVLGVEICEDMWVPITPAAELALAGATVVVNLSASPITIGRAEDRMLLGRSTSARCLTAYLYAAGGAGESTTDLAWDGQTFIYELGDLLGESERFAATAVATVADLDTRRIAAERARQGSFDDNRRTHAQRLGRFRRISFTLAPPMDDIGLRRHVDRFPFVPDDPSRLALDCYEAYSIQVAGLEQRLRAIGGDRQDGPRPVIGVSGGLDSTHALIVCARAMDRLGRDRSDILTVTMPGFATTAHTRTNAQALSEALGVSFEELDIRGAATQMLIDMGHPFGRGEPVYDITFENVQAGLRYDYLFRIANQRNGIVIGTGDLSELALGWCTYGVGDQMSHYTVNSGVPKTLMQHLIRWVVSEGLFESSVNELLLSILGTEITPELVPTQTGERPQSTEESIGPYALHDFTLYQVLRLGSGPGRAAFLAWHAWHDVDQGQWPAGYPDHERTAYDLATIRHWMEVFHRRFFTNQFKRSALPNGPKVLAGGALSPRGDWRMPSDVSAAAWLAELDRDVPPHDRADVG
ncbi:NAD(+) synthase [Tessaracoccus sp. SD287]|uniref:NAD(+) synthase n=1 Tax=Tessaracoccus sp. SD287 TaxID=2782008 RepID=UPI001A97054D|nr:NAD(+) synthase [Tessaracoccus sp. SD287]MBO1032057.1 NAD(+) synthase [Tessaracoccus sp. SD287]